MEKLNKPRLAIEYETKNDYHDWERSYTKYFDIEDKNEIIKAIKSENKYTRISRMYYATNYGIEIEYEKESS